MAETRIAALVLAAGSARRFGRQKLLESFRGGVLLESALLAAFASSAEDVVLVTGADADEVASAAEKIARAQGRELRIIHAKDHLDGLSASLRAGIATLPSNTSYVLVFLGDMPDIPLEIVPALLGALASGYAAAAPVCDGLRGHPVAFRSTLFPYLVALTGDRGAGALLAALGNDLALIKTSDRGVLRDVDRPQDLV